MQEADWRWNEMQQVGTDYADLAQVEIFDTRMASFRDVDAENREILALLDLPQGACVLEIGCGTGRFARTACAAGLEVTALDVSQSMLAYVVHKAQIDGVKTLTTQHAGFLTMNLPEAHFDAAVSGAALHHLPDAWKLVALRNIFRVLKSGGQFLLRDVVFVLDAEEAPEACFERFAASIPNMRLEAARHVAQEFSTYDWIMEGLIERAGFLLVSRQVHGGTFVQYHCRTP